MNKREAQLQKRFTKYAKEVGVEAGGYELKVCACFDFNGDDFMCDGRIGFSSLREHQVVALCSVQGGCWVRDVDEDGDGVGDVFSLPRGIGNERLVYKISDSAIGYKPFDCVVLSGVKGWFVFGFCGGRIYQVGVQKVVDLMYGENGERKRGSITLEWCREVGKRLEV